MGAKAALCVALCLVAAHAAQAVLVSRFSPEADMEFGYHPAEWLDLGRADHGEELQVTFALRQRDTAGLLRYFNMVSDPRSTWYGAYLSRDEVREQYGLHCRGQCIGLRRTWVVSAGIIAHGDGGAHHR